MSLLRAPEAAALLGIPEHTLRRYTSQGAIPCVRLGRSVYWSSVVLTSWEAGDNGSHDGSLWAFSRTDFRIPPSVLFPF